MPSAENTGYPKGTTCRGSSARQAARSTPAGLAGATSNQLIARGITACNFAQSGASTTQAQTVSVRLTVTRNNDSITLQHQSRAEFLP